MRIVAAALALLLSTPPPTPYSTSIHAFVLSPNTPAFYPHLYKSSSFKNNKKRRPFESVPLSSGWVGGTGWADNLSGGGKDGEEDEEDENNKQPQTSDGEVFPPPVKGDIPRSMGGGAGSGEVQEEEEEVDTGGLMDALDDLIVQAELDMTEDEKDEKEEEEEEEHALQWEVDETTENVEQNLVGDTTGGEGGGGGLLDVLDDALGQMEEKDGAATEEGEDTTGEEELMQWGEEERIPSQTTSDAEEEIVGDGMQWGEAEIIPSPQMENIQPSSSSSSPPQPVVGDELLQWGEEQSLPPTTTSDSSTTSQQQNDGVLQWGEDQDASEKFDNTQHKEVTQEMRMNYKKEEEAEEKEQEMRWRGKVDDTREWKVKDGLQYNSDMQETQQEGEKEEDVMGLQQQQQQEEEGGQKEEGENDQLVMWDSEWLPDELAGSLEDKIKTGRSELEEGKEVEAFLNVDEQLNAPEEEIENEEIVVAEGGDGGGGLLDVLDDALGEIEEKESVGAATVENDDEEEEEEELVADAAEEEEEEDPMSLLDALDDLIVQAELDMVEDTEEEEEEIKKEEIPKPLGSGDYLRSNTYPQSSSIETEFKPLGSGDRPLDRLPITPGSTAASEPLRSGNPVYENIQDLGFDKYEGAFGSKPFGSGDDVRQQGRFSEYVPPPNLIEDGKSNMLPPEPLGSGDRPSENNVVQGKTEDTVAPKPFGSGDLRGEYIPPPPEEEEEEEEESAPQPLGSGNRPSDNNIQGKTEDTVASKPFGSGDVKSKYMPTPPPPPNVKMMDDEDTPKPLGSGDFRPQPGEESVSSLPPGPGVEQIDIVSTEQEEEEKETQEEEEEEEEEEYEESISQEEEEEEEEEELMEAEEDTRRWKVTDGVEKKKAVKEGVKMWDDEWKPEELKDGLEEEKKVEEEEESKEELVVGKDSTKDEEDEEEEKDEQKKKQVQVEDESSSGWLPDELMEDDLEEEKKVESPAEEKELVVKADVAEEEEKEEKKVKVEFESVQTIPPPPSAKVESTTKPDAPITSSSSSSSEPQSKDKIPSPPSSSAPGSAGQTFDLPVPHAFDPLFEAASLATVPRAAVDMAGAHDKFRFEWGTWVDDDAIHNLMERINEVRLERGAYESLLGDDDGNVAVRYRVASGKDWEAILHVLPPGSSHPAQWTTGSWIILKCLTGLSEISIRRGPDRDGKYKKLRPRELRGGGDGTLGGGRSTAGADCIKYVGGPERCYDGKAGKTVLFEMILSPPVGERKSSEVLNGDGAEGIPALENVGDMLSIAVVEKAKAEDESKEEETKVEETKVQAKSIPSKTPVARDDKVDSKPTKKEVTSESAGASLSSSTTTDDSNETKKTPSTESSSPENKQRLNEALGVNFENVGGLDAQLDSIARRVLASRANPEAARRLGISHVRGVLLSGPPGCGKTLLARELAGILGAREPQIVNGPEILDKFIGEAEKKVRDLFAPAEAEYKEVGDDSALHIIILDEMDAIARKRGSMTSDTTGVRDSVVNQLLAKMDGVKEASNVLVVGLTNRPELLDPALLRPGRLEVQLRVELPDRSGRRDILRIHTRRMKETRAISDDALLVIESLGDGGLAANTEHFTGAELAGLVRSAASFALARAVENKGGQEEDSGMVTKADLIRALGEVRPALGKQDEVLRQRYPLGVSPCCFAMERIQRDLKRFTAPPVTSSVGKALPHFKSLMLVGSGGNGGAGVTALAAWAAACASTDGSANYVRFITALDILVTSSGSSGDEARASALADKFAEAKEMSQALLVLDDVDQLCAGDGPGGYSTVMLATLRALLRSPPISSTTAKAGGESISTRDKGRTFNVIATTSRSDAACNKLHELFDETIVVPLLSDPKDVQKLLEDSLPRDVISDPQSMAELMTKELGGVGCKTALRLAEQAISSVERANDGRRPAGANLGRAQVAALAEMLNDLSGDKLTAQNLCEVLP